MHLLSGEHHEVHSKWCWKKWNWNYTEKISRACLCRGLTWNPILLPALFRLFVQDKIQTILYLLLMLNSRVISLGFHIFQLVSMIFYYIPIVKQHKIISFIILLLILSVLIKQPSSLRLQKICFNTAWI